jgi:dTDP-4-dehydrorhamnose reductase
MNVLVLGESGQLARHLRELLPAAEFWGRAKLDFGQPAEVSAAIEAYRPSAIVNAAAYTAVDKAESDRDAAWRINAEAPAMLARAAAVLDVPLVHVSTDYVFDGKKDGEYETDDPCNPVNVYGASKLAGELAVRTLCPRSWILRTSWVFSEYGSNFLKTILRLAAEREELRIVADQHGRPTYAEDVARVIAGLVAAPRADARVAHGTYHAVGGPAVSWHAFAEAIVAAGIRHGMLRRSPRVTPIETSDYPSAARRPANSVLQSTAELAAALGVEIDWRRGVARALTRLANMTPER